MSTLDDPRYIHIGDLPSGGLCYECPEDVFVRYITVQEMLVLNMGAILRDPRHILRAVQLCTNVDIKTLTDGDFYYVMAWLRLHSFPKAPVTSEWTCVNSMLVHSDTRSYYEDQQATVYPSSVVRETCNCLNTQLIHNPKLNVTTLEDDFAGLPANIGFPTVDTLVDYLTKAEEDTSTKDFYYVARMVKAGSCLEDKIRILEKAPLSLYEDIQEVRKIYDHGVSETLGLKCRMCEYKTDYTLKPDLFSFFANNTEQTILDIQYSLQQALGAVPDNTMTAKQLLYFHSCLAKDVREKEEQRRATANSRGGGTTTIMGSK